MPRKKRKTLELEDDTPPTVEVEEKPSALQAWLTKAPQATTGVPTLRWYGEEFLPAYTAWLQEGKKLVE